jgi:hypothetical protein
MAKRKPEKHNYHTKWTPFYRCDTYGDGQPIPDDFVVLKNNVYTVHISGCDVKPPMGPVAWLSIKRNDKQVIRDWRELQRIKNLIMGEEIEAVEIFPAESRLQDTANQYHLWCFAPGYQLPFGYTERIVADDKAPIPGGAGLPKQRAFSPDDRPDDCLSGTELQKMFGADPTLGAKLVHRRLIAEMKK